MMLGQYRVCNLADKEPIKPAIENIPYTCIGCKISYGMHVSQYGPHMFGSVSSGLRPRPESVTRRGS